MVLNGRVSLDWQRFNNFFDLYELLKNEPKLFYVIGETHYCYIGSVGGRGGLKGLAQRYQKQYMDRAVAIFGSSSPVDQPAFASVVTDPNISVSDIEPIERQMQGIFISKHGRSSALFTPRGNASDFQLVHRGSFPSFLS